MCLGKFNGVCLIKFIDMCNVFFHPLVSAADHFVVSLDPREKKSLLIKTLAHKSLIVAKGLRTTTSRYVLAYGNMFPSVKENSEESEI